MIQPPLPDGWAEDFGWLTQALDPRARLVRLVRMDDASYRDASFLDDRLLSQNRESRLCGLDEMIAASEVASGPPAGWIFHLGHVGSTLVSRLLGELDAVLALREPRALRDLAAADEGERPRLAGALERLMARRGPAHQIVIVKATSFVSEYASQLARAGAAVLFLYATPEKSARSEGRPDTSDTSTPCARPACRSNAWKVSLLAARTLPLYTAQPVLQYCRSCQPSRMSGFGTWRRFRCAAEFGRCRRIADTDNPTRQIRVHGLVHWRGERRNRSKRPMTGSSKAGSAR